MYLISLTIISTKSRETKHYRVPWRQVKALSKQYTTDKDPSVERH